MRKRQLIEVFQLELTVPRELSRLRDNQVRRCLDGRGFRTQLGRAIRVFIKQFEELRQVRVRITQ